MSQKRSFSRRSHDAREYHSVEGFCLQPFSKLTDCLRLTEFFNSRVSGPLDRPRGLPILDNKFDVAETAATLLGTLFGMPRQVHSGHSWPLVALLPKFEEKSE
jgi:hypothetical protein